MLCFWRPYARYIIFGRDPYRKSGRHDAAGVQVLTDADLIAAEDTRRTLQLLNHFSIKGKLIHYDENNKENQ